MNFKTVDKHVTKSCLVYILLPKSIRIVTPTPKNKRYYKGRNTYELVRYTETLTENMPSLIYSLPQKAIALEEYIDYFVVNVGDLAPENRFKSVISLATEKEKGLILKPPNNTAHLYLMDKLVVGYNELFGYEPRIFE